MPAQNECVQANSNGQVALFTDRQLMIDIYNQHRQGLFEEMKQTELKQIKDQALLEIERLDREAQKLIEEDDATTSNKIRRIENIAKVKVNKTKAIFKKKIDDIQAKLERRKEVINETSQKRIHKIEDEAREKKEFIAKVERQKIEQLNKHSNQMMIVVNLNNQLMGNFVNQDRETVAPPPDNHPEQQLSEPAAQLAPTPSSSSIQEEFTTSLRNKFIIRELHCMEGCTWKGDDFLDHLKMVHQIKEFRCLVKDCNESYDHDSQLKVHLYERHSKGKLQCRMEKCTQSFDKFSNLKGHYVKSHQKGIFACIHFPACPKVVYTRESAYQHRSKCIVRKEAEKAAALTDSTTMNLPINLRKTRKTIDIPGEVSPQRSVDNLNKKQRT